MGGYPIEDEAEDEAARKFVSVPVVVDGVSLGASMLELSPSSRKLSGRLSGVSAAFSADTPPWSHASKITLTGIVDSHLR